MTTGDRKYELTKKGYARIDAMTNSEEEEQRYKAKLMGLHPCVNCMDPSILQTSLGWMCRQCYIKESTFLHEEYLEGYFDLEGSKGYVQGEFDE